jgi:hypothetical protein
MGGATAPVALNRFTTILATVPARARPVVTCSIVSPAPLPWVVMLLARHVVPAASMM